MKLRRGVFNEVSVTYPDYLHHRGVRHIIPNLPSSGGKLWVAVGEFKLILSPYIEGSSAYQVALSERQWLEFGETLRHIHEFVPPAALTRELPQETYSDQFRTKVEALLERARAGLDPLAGDMMAFLKSKHDDVLHLVKRTRDLAAHLKTQKLVSTVCHADLHAGNLLIDEDGGFYLVDWDTLLRAPKERDLMFIGAGLLGGHCKPSDERELFFKGYGRTEVSSPALAYFRYERIVQDVTAFGEELLSGAGSEENRAQALEYLKANFLPDATIDLALRAERSGH